jgi:hypothetical protein
MVGYSSVLPVNRKGIVNQINEIRIISAPKTTPLYISGCFLLLLPI